MKNIVISVSKETKQITKMSQTKIANDGENYQAKLIFNFSDEFVNGTARVEYKLQDDNEKYYQMLTKVEETYEIPIKSVITKEGRIFMQLVITQSEVDEEIPIFKSNVFYVYVDESINAEAEEPSEYPTWLEIANSKLAEIDDAIAEVGNIDITASKVDTTTTITITDKDGVEHTTEILDGTNGLPGKDGKDGEPGATGVGLNYNWNGTSLGVKREDESQYSYTNLKGETGAKGDPGQAGRDGYVQYTAGNNITIENNVISATGGESGVIPLNVTKNQLYSYANLRDNFGVVLGKPYLLKNKIKLGTTEYNYKWLNEGTIIWFGNSGSEYVYIKPYQAGILDNPLSFDFKIGHSPVGGSADYDFYISKNNTTSYTPASDYNPATKKYVDDAIAGAGGGGGTPDNITTRKNSSDELETIGIYTAQNNAIKFWEGTLAQYNALQQKDSDTYYNITDDELANGLPQGGTTGQVLKKASSTDYDASWVSEHNYTHETWTFTLEDDSTVDKEVVLW